MSITYRGPDGRLYRVSERPDAKGGYYIEYRDPAASAVYKPLPGYHHNANCDNVVAQLSELAKDHGLVAVDEPAAPEKPKGTGSAAKSAVATEPIPEWAMEIAREFVSRKWVRELDYFSAACLQASHEAKSYAGGTCGPGFADTSPKDIKLWRPGAGDVTYTWAKFVQACKAAGIDPKAPAPAAGPATAEPPEIVDECSDRDTPPAAEPAAIAVPPAAEIAAPAFDFSALGDLAEQAAEDDQEFDFHAARVREEYGFACVYLARVHDLTARAGRYGGGTWTKWCEAKGLSEGTAKRMLEIGDGFKSANLADLKNLAVFGKGELRAIATSGSEEVKEAATAGDTERVKGLLAQLKATEAAKAEAERKVKGLETSYRTAHANEEYNIDLRKKATEEATEAKRALNAALDQQGEYIAKIRELEKRPRDVDVARQLPSEAEIEQWRKEGEERARASMAGQAPTTEEIAKLANGYAAQIDGMRAVLVQLTQGMDRQAVTHAADKLCLAADRLHDLIMYGPEAYGHG